MRAARRTGLLLALLGALLLGGRPARTAPEAEWTRPYGPVLPGTEPVDAEGYRELVAVRVLGLGEDDPVPVAGARVSCWSEETEPEALRSHKLGEGVTDEHGIVNVRWPGDGPHPFHWVVEADGWAVWHDAGIGECILLEPAVTHRLRVLDPLGRPAKGARVECFHGCPHAPALRVAVADETGAAVLPGLAASFGGQLWIELPGASAGPYDLPSPRVGDDAGPTLVLRLGRTASGVVTGPDGKPLTGIVVREIGYPRGPVTSTDEQGRFRLVGLDGGETIGFFHPDAPFDTRPSLTVAEFADDVPLRVVLRRDRPRAQAEGEARHRLDVRVLRRWPEEGTETMAYAVPVVLTRRADGSSNRRTVGLTGGVDRGGSVSVPHP